MGITDIERDSQNRSPGPAELVSSPPDRLQTFEQGIAAAWHGTEGALIDLLASVRSNVRRGSAAVATTAHAVQGAVHDATDATGWALDVPARVRAHPWLAVGGAVLLGVALGQLSRRSRRPAAAENQTHE